MTDMYTTDSDLTFSNDGEEGIFPFLGIEFEGVFAPTEDGAVGDDLASMEPMLGGYMGGFTPYEAPAVGMPEQSLLYDEDAAGAGFAAPQFGESSSFPIFDSPALDLYEQDYHPPPDEACGCSSTCHSAYASGCSSPLVISAMSSPLLKSKQSYEEFSEPYAVSDIGKGESFLSPPKKVSVRSRRSNSNTSLSTGLERIALQANIGDFLTVANPFQVSPSSPTPSNASASDCKRSCPRCGKHFSNTGNRNKHMMTACKYAPDAAYRAKFWCQYCGHGSTTKSNNHNHQIKWCKRRPGTLLYAGYVATQDDTL